MDDVRFSVLGTVRVTVGGRDVAIGNSRERSVLALLLVEPNRVVESERIVAVLWPDQEVTRPWSVLHVYVARLRRVLTGAGSTARIERRSGGYLLAVDESLIDVTAARSLLDRARNEKRAAYRVPLLEEALALWHEPKHASVDNQVVAALLADLRTTIWTELTEARISVLLPPGGELAGQHLLPDAVVAFVDGDLSWPAHDRAAAHVAQCARCAAEVAAQRQVAAGLRDAPLDGAVVFSVRPDEVEPVAVPGDADEFDDFPSPGGGVDTIVRAGTLPVSIYLADGAGHEAVEAAVARAMEMAGAPIAERDDPVLGSWFRRMRANPAARELAMTAAHVADTRLVHEADAQVTATLLQHIGPVITALQQEKEAVVRLGAVLIVKVNGQLMVHQLTAVQQFRLDHQPHVVAPRDILATLGLPATNGHQCSTEDSVHHLAERQQRLGEGGDEGVAGGRWNAVQ
jgi:DNA-binding winged helix-turn-helix (wHTH) protein